MRKRLLRPPKWHHPEAAQRAYARALVRVVSGVFRAAKEVVLDHLPPILAAVEPRARADSWSDDLQRLLDEFRLRVDREENLLKPAEIAGRAAFDVSAFNLDQWKNLLRKSLGVDLFAHEPWLRDELKSWTRENASRIGDLGNTAQATVAKIVEKGVRDGRRFEAIGEDIQKARGVSVRRADLLARDQVATLNANLTQKRQTEAGVKRYVWRTSLDERVRGNPGGLYPKALPSHYKREGKEYAWSDPPHEDDVDGNPGEPPLCRCTAEPVLEDLVDEGGKGGRTMLLPSINPLDAALPDETPGPVEELQTEEDE